jgi:predicted nuclease of predicted toxin-antitoxin system
VKIFLDENLPRKLVDVLRAEGHDVESVHTLHMQGLANGKLYEFAKESYDLCFTRDSGFANAVRGASVSTRLRLLRVTLVQKPHNKDQDPPLKTNIFFYFFSKHR